MPHKKKKHFKDRILFLKNSNKMTKYIQSDHKTRHHSNKHFQLRYMRTQKCQEFKLTEQQYFRY